MNKQHTIIVGIDWADAEHAWHLIDQHNNENAGILEQSPQAIAAIIHD